VPDLTAATPQTQPSADLAALARAAARRREHRRRAAAARLHRAAEKEAAATEKLVQPSSLVRIESLLPSVKSGDESHSRLLQLAAGILLALVLASGSLLSVATRMMKGQLR
jgi:hypothetical protein